MSDLGAHLNEAIAIARAVAEERCRIADSLELDAKAMERWKNPNKEHIVMIRGIASRIVEETKMPDWIKRSYSPGSDIVTIGGTKFSGLLVDTIEGEAGPNGAAAMFRDRSQGMARRQPIRLWIVAIRSAKNLRTRCILARDQRKEVDDD